MFAKKFMIVLLALGALLIVILLGVGYKFSSKVRGELENTLNAYLQEASQKNGDFGIDYQPFVCTGISSYECKTQEISLIDKENSKPFIRFSDFVLSISDIQTSSIQIDLKSSKISFDGFNTQIQDSKNASFTKLYETLMPTSFECHEKASIHSKGSGEISSDDVCILKSKNMEYTYKLSWSVKSSIFEGKTILNDMIAYYSKMDLFNTHQEDNDFEFKIYDTSLSLASSDLKEVLYPIFEKDYNSQPNTAKVPFNDEIYTDGVANIKGLAGFVIGAFGGLPDSYMEALSGFIDGVEGMANNKVKEVTLRLYPKENSPSSPPYFKISPELESNLDKIGTQQRIMAKIFNHYKLGSYSLPNDSK